MDWKSEPNKRALAILRVSSHRQTDNFSHELQESEIHEYCKKHQLSLVEVRKITESAKNSKKRHQYNGALDWALSNGCLHVLFFVADRESRNLQDVEQNEKSVRKGKICIHYVRDNRVLHKTSPDGDFFLRDILAASNKQFVRTLSGKVSDAMRKKVQEGWLPSNHVPLGYVYQRNKDENSREKKRGTTIVPDSNPQTIRLVLREFELRAQGEYAFRKGRFERAADKIAHLTALGIEFREGERVFEAGCGDGAVIISLQKQFGILGFGADFAGSVRSRA